MLLRGTKGARFEECVRVQARQQQQMRMEHLLPRKTTAAPACYQRFSQREVGADAELKHGIALTKDTAAR